MITSADILPPKWAVNESIAFDACKPEKKKIKWKKKGKIKLALSNRRCRFGSRAGQELHKSLFNAAFGTVLSVEET